MTTPFDIRRGGDRFVSHFGGVTSRSSFSFGAHYDPDNLAFGPLLAHNEDILVARAGYAAHPHRDLEIVTWVIAGVLHHRDGAGHETSVEAGGGQKLSAGCGVRHSEFAGESGAHYVQMLLTPDVLGAAPAYETASVPLRVGDWSTVVSGSGDGVMGVGRADARLAVARLSARDTVVAPAAARTHLFVARGTVETSGAVLAAGDAVRMTSPACCHVTAREDAELVCWSFDS